MAYTSVIPVHRLDRAVDYVRDKSKILLNSAASLQEAVDYALNRSKTEKSAFETGLGCDCATAFEDMKICKQRWHKLEGVQGYHLVQSFAAGEVTPELSHQIGVELARQLLGGKYQCIVTTHLNTDHIHNHMVWNSVALDTGHKYRSNAKSYYLEVRAKSDALCLKYGLSVIEDSGNRSKPYAEWQADREGKPTWKTAVQQDIEEALVGAVTWKQLLKQLELKGYEFKLNRKYPALRPPGKERYIRFHTLGSRYSTAALQMCILYPSRSLPAGKKVTFSRVRLKGKIANARKLTGLQALYYRYLYELGAFPRKPRSSYAVRQDARNLQKRIRQMEFLTRHDIHTLDQLKDYHRPIEDVISKLTKERYHLYRTQPDSPRIEEITHKLKPLRREEKLCRQIAQQSVQLEQRLREAQEQRCQQAQQEQNRTPNMNYIR